MHFSSTFLTLAQLASISFVLAIHPSNPPTRTLHRTPRALIDTCVSLDANVALDGAGLLSLLDPLLKPLVVSVLSDTCLCLKDLDVYLATNNDVRGLTELLGKHTVEGLLTAIIATSPNAHQCDLPTHARRSCNKEDPCHWTCENNFSRQDDVCVCLPPNNICNGICGVFSEGCTAVPSAVPRSLKMTSIAIPAKANLTCKTGEAICGLPGRRDAFECINIDNSLDSCGGCIVADSFTGVPLPSGKDCSKLPNAIETECAKRTCVVYRCKAGFRPNKKRDACIRNMHATLRRHRKRNSVLYADFDLRSQLVNLFDLALKLKQSYSRLSASDDDYGHKRRFAWRAVQHVSQGLAAVLTSPQVASLVANTNNLLGSVTASSKQLNECDCVESLGLQDIVIDLDAIHAGTTNLSQWLVRNPIGVVTSTSSSGSGSATTNDMPLILDLSGLLNKTRWGSDATSDGSGNDSDALANALLDGLDLDPKLMTDLNALLDLVLRLVFDANDVIKPSSLSINPTLQANIGDVVKATTVFIHSTLNDRSVVTDSPASVNLTGAVKHALEASRQSDQLASIILDLDKITDFLATMSGQSLPSSDSKGDIDIRWALNDLYIKGLRIDTALTDLGLPRTSLNSTVVAALSLHP